MLRIKKSQKLAVMLCMVNAFTLFAEPTLPAACQALAVQGESVQLKPTKSSLFLIHNIATTDIWITQLESNAGDAVLTSKLQPDGWSALGVSKGAFTLGCIESTPGHEQQVPCEGIIALCAWKKAKIPSTNQSISWIGENLSLSGLKAAIGGKGVVLP